MVNYSSTINTYFKSFSKPTTSIVYAESQDYINDRTKSKGQYTRVLHYNPSKYYLSHIKLVFE